MADTDLAPAVSTTRVDWTRIILASINALTVLGGLLGGLFLLPRVLQPFVEITRALSGRTTNVAISIGISYTLTIAASGTAVFWRYKLWRQGNELRRLRERASRLEGENARLQAIVGNDQ